jgi:PAS domain S-box-containing protein
MSDQDRKTILLVEDEAIVALGEKRQLEKEDYRILLARTGEEALELVCLQNEPVDLILMDINLGAGMDGTETARQILSRKNIPLIFLSSHTEKEVVEKTEAITSYGYIVKNSSPTVLSASIKMAFKLHRAHQQLLESEERYRTLVESSPDGIGIHREGRLLYVNPATVRLFHATGPEEMIGLPITRLVHPDFHSRLAERMRRNENHLPSPAEEVKLLTLDGETLDAESIAAPIIYQGQPATQTIVRDIRERKRLDNALRVSEAHYRELFEISQDGIVGTDLQGRYLECNQAYLDLLGYASVEQLRLKSYEEVTPREYHAMETRIIQEQTLARGFCDEYEKEYFRATGERLPVSLRAWLRRGSNGQPIGMWVVVRNIAERKQAEAALKHSQVFLDNVIERSPNALWISDEHGTLLRMNQACRDILHLHDAEVVGKYNIFEDNLLEAQGFLPLVKAVFEKGVSARFVISYDTSAIQGLELAQTTRVDLDVHISPILDAAGKVTNAIIQHVDISQRKRAEEALQERENNLATFFDGVDDLLFVLDLEGRIIKANATACQRLKYKPEELVGQSVLQVHPPERRVEAGQIVLDMLAGRRQECPVPVMTKDGTLIEVETHITRGQWDGQEVLFGVTKDLSLLKRSEEKFAKAFRMNASIMAISTLEEGVYVDVNEAFCASLGYAREEVLGKTPEELFLNEDLAQRKQLFENLERNGRLRNLEFKLCARDGSVREGLFSAERIDLDGKPHLLTLFVDVTERKHAENALRESEARYRQLVEGTPGVVYTFSSKRGGIYYSAHVQEVLGYSLEYLYAHPRLWNESIHPEDRNAIGEVIRDFELGKPFDIEYRIRDAAGKWRWLQDRSIGRQVVEDEIFIEGLAIEITQRKQFEEALQAKTIELDHYFGSSLDLLCIADLDGSFRRLNPEWEKTLGYSLADLVGKNFLDFVHADDQASTLAALTQLNSRETVLNFENRYRCKDGSYRWIEWRSRPVGNSIYAAARDITERKRIEDQISTLLHEKELLLKEVHHRIKNNMNTISSLLQLQMEVQENATARLALQDAASRVQSMLILYDKLYRSENFSAVSIQEYFPALLDEVTSLFPHKDSVRIETQIENIFLAPKKLSPLGIILTELTTNAMKHAFPGRSDGVIAITAVKRGASVLIRFEDNGHGLPEAVTFANSSGFGMQLVEMLVKQIRGSISIERNRGTGFLLEFPAE